MSAVAAVGVDLGGTHARAAVVDSSSGTVRSSVKSAHSDDKRPETIAASIARAVNAALEEAKLSSTSDVGVAVAGQLRGDSVAVAPNLGWRDVPFGAMLEQALGRRVRLVNDLKAAAWGEFKAGFARGSTDSLTVFIGSGVGAAQISNSALVLGATGVAGEFGHIKLVPESGRKCGCGESGCLEAYAGGHKLAEWMAEVGLPANAAELELLAAKGNAEAVRLYDFVTGHSALAIANLVTMLNPGTLVLGGGVLVRSPKWTSRIVETIGARSSMVSRGLKIGLASLGDDAGVVGAALLSH